MISDRYFGTLSSAVPWMLWSGVEEVLTADQLTPSIGFRGDRCQHEWISRGEDPHAELPSVLGPFGFESRLPLAREELRNEAT